MLAGNWHIHSKPERLKNTLQSNAKKLNKKKFYDNIRCWWIRIWNYEWRYFNDNKLLPVRVTHNVQIPPCIGTKKAVLVTRSLLLLTLATNPSSNHCSLIVPFANWSNANLSQVISSQWSVIMEPHSIPVAQVVNTKVPSKKNTLGCILQFHPDCSVELASIIS